MPDSATPRGLSNEKNVTRRLGPLHWRVMQHVAPPSELLADRLAFQALRTGEDVETGRIVPPLLGISGTLRADAVVINLSNEMHWASAALRNLIALNPERNAKELPFVLRRCANDFERFRVVLQLAVHEFELVKSFNALRALVELDDERLIALRDDAKAVRRADERPSELVGR